MFSNRSLLIIITAAFILRILLLCPYLEDWDSVQFALAIHHFSVADNLPQAPGYILYIFVAKIFYLFTRSDTLALTLLSSILGTLSAVPFFHLARKLSGETPALIGTLIFLCIPLPFVLSLVGLTNIVGMFFTILCASLLFQKSKRLLYLGSFLSGITLGFRFAEYSILIALLILILIRTKSPKLTLNTFVLFLAGCLVWVLPLILVTGPSSLINSYMIQSHYIIQHDSLQAYTSLIERILVIKSLIIQSYSKYFLLLLIPIIVYFFIKGNRIFGRFEDQFLTVWIISYALPLILVYNLEVPRHVLPLIPPIMLYFIRAVNKFGKASYIFLIVAVLLLQDSIRQGLILHNQVPPSVQPVLFVKKHFDPKNTLLVTTFTYRQFQYYAPEFKNYYGLKNLPDNLPNQVILDYLGLKNQTTKLNAYKIASTQSFSGPALIYPRLPKTEIFVLEK